MVAHLYRSPWGLFCDADACLLEGNDAELLTPLIPCITSPTSAETDLWGTVPLSEIQGYAQQMQRYAMPLNPKPSQESAHFHIQQEIKTRIHLPGLAQRKPEAEQENDLRERWIIEQMQLLKNICSLDSKEENNDFDCTFGAITRRSWNSISKIWQDRKDERAEESLIVKIARDRKILQAIRGIAISPRKLLRSVHRQTKLSRVRKMDSFSLRAYSKAPGKTAAEKGGAKQEILAVVQEDSVDLIENQLFIWVLKRFVNMCRAYLERNQMFKETEKFKKVAILLSVSSKALRSNNLKDIKALAHLPTAPTYCLQFNSNYRKIWRAYQDIRKQHKEQEDAWKWQSILWSTTAKQMCLSLLLNSPEVEEEAKSTAYFHVDNLFRRQVASIPSTPGPFMTPGGRCFALDGLNCLMDEKMHASLPSACFDSAADLSLLWPDEKLGCLIWAPVANDSEADPPDLEILADKLKSISSAWKWHAWIFLAMPNAEDFGSQISFPHEGITVFRLPQKATENWQHLQDQFNKSIRKIYA